MKKLLSILLILVMVFTFAACGSKDDSTGGGDKIDYDAIPDTCESDDGTYAIAMVTDVGQLKDGSFN